MATHAHSTPTPQARRTPAPLASRAWTENAIAALIDHLDALDAATEDMEPDYEGEDTDGSHIAGWLL